MTTHFIVTGTGRSGTGFVAQTLNRSGVKCGHEQVYGGRKSAWLSDPFNISPPWGDYVAEASWLAAPIRTRWPTYLVVRHPLEVVRSCLETQELRKLPAAYNRYRQRVLPFIWNIPQESERILTYWVHWNLIAERNSDKIFLLEDLGKSEFATMANIPEKRVHLAAKDTNKGSIYAHYRSLGRALTWGEFPQRLAEQARHMWSRYENT